MTSGKRLELDEEGEGILDTHVTWEVVEQALQKVLQTKANFGKSKAATNLADGVGFASIIALVEPDWSGDEIDQLPQKIVVKMPTCLNARRMHDHIPKPEGFDFEMVMKRWKDTIKTLHNAETAFYNFVQQNVKDYEELLLPNVYYSKPFHGEDDAVGFLIMEFVENIEINHLYDTISKQKAAQALKAWARLQAFTYTDELMNSPAFSKNNYRIIYEEMMELSNIKSMIDTMASENHDDHVKQLCQRVSDIASEIYDFDRIESECHRRGMHPVIAHGDLWSTNVMWDKETKNLRCLIDFQIIHLGSPGEDIARFLITSMSGEERRAHEDALIEEYYEDFAEFMRGKEMPFTLDQLKANYRSVFPFNALINVAMFGPVLQYATVKIKDETEKAMVKGKCNEKIIAMFEDLLRLHSEND